MKHLPTLLALAVLAWIALALWLVRPETPDGSLFGEEVALAPELPPLAAPLGTLALTGEVHTADGAPAADVYVALVREEDALEAEPVLRAYSDATGRFAIERVTPGSYRIALIHPSVPPRMLPLSVPKEGVAPLDLQLLPPLPPLPVLPDLGRTPIEGRITSAEGLVSSELFVQGFEVVLRPTDDTPALAGAPERRVRADAEGRFALDDLVVASYRVEVLPPWARGGSWPVVGRGVCAPLGDAAAHLALALDVGAMEGTLRESGGRALVGALVKVSALDALDAVGQPQLWPPLVSDPEGRFRVELLPPGRYRVHVRAGAAARDVDVTIESGKVTSVDVEPIDAAMEKGAVGTEPR